MHTHACTHMRTCIHRIPHGTINAPNSQRPCGQKNAEIIFFRKKWCAVFEMLRTPCHSSGGIGVGAQHRVGREWGWPPGKVGLVEKGSPVASYKWRRLTTLTRCVGPRLFFSGFVSTAKFKWPFVVWTICKIFRGSCIFAANHQSYHPHPQI